MISLKGSVDDYERSLLRRSVQALLQTLEAVREYTVETDAAAFAGFRGHLDEIRAQLEPAVEVPTESVISSVPSGIRATLRDYRDRAVAYLDRLRADLATTEAALQNLLSSMMGEGSDAERTVEREIANLRAIEDLKSIAAMRIALRRSAAALTEGVERLRREQETLIVQLKGEIVTLQQSMERAHTAATLDELTEVLKKGEFIRLLRRDIVSSREAGVIHIWLSNLHPLTVDHGDSVPHELLRAFSKRLRSVVPAGAVAGMWAADVFCVLLPKSMLRPTSAKIAKSCLGRYVYLEQGTARTVQLQATITSLACQAGDEADGFIRKLDELPPRSD